MEKVYKIKKGLSLKLEGQAERVLSKTLKSTVYAVKPSDFNQLTPKLLIEEGTKVKAGTPLFCDKNNNSIICTSPISGTVQSVVRGEKRIILAVTIQADDEMVYESFPIPQELTRENITNILLSSGAWLFFKQRPFNIIADTDKIPEHIFISGFATAPLAADPDFLVNGEKSNFQAGIDILNKLTTGKVHLSLHAHYPPNPTFENVKGVEKHYFSGVHPVGNVGVQIDKIAPLTKNSNYWTINPQHVIALGKLFTQGIYDVSKIIALAGHGVEKPRYFRVVTGLHCSAIKNLLMTDQHYRIISGDVLTGTSIGEDGFLSFYDNEITVIPEGDTYEFMGWMMPRFSKFSAYRSYFSWLMPDKVYNLNTNVNGGERAFFFTGKYEKVLPIDVYVTYLMKAILANDIDKMEALGIYEVVEEDIALCEFICPSKIEMQKILRQGINALLSELS